MNAKNARKLLCLAALGLLALSPRPAPAAPAVTANTDTLTTQEREVLALANDLARRCGETIEKWIAANEVTEDRLWSALYYPIEKTDPPKFNTDWDSLSDRDILPLEEATLAKSSTFVYAVMADRNGYVASHNTRYVQPLTGNTAVDWAGNRTKRIFNGHMQVAAQRSTAPFIIQRYTRDNGETMVDLSVPVLVRGKPFGVVSIGFRPAAQ